MDSALLDKICDQVYRKFPEIAGIRPKVQTQADTGNLLLTFKSSVKTEDGKSLPRIIRIVATEQGKILKSSTSR